MAESEKDFLGEDLTNIRSVDDQYKGLLQTILKFGQLKGDPQGVGNLAIPGYGRMRFDLSGGYLPLITLRDMSGSWKAIVGELLWFISGSTNNKNLTDQGIHIWDQWAEATQKEFGYPQEELGPIYGKQWRSFDAGGAKPVDQLSRVMELLGTNPDSRRPAVTVWNPREIDNVFIAPCIPYFQFFHAGNELSLCYVQRSADAGVGVPFDLTEYALLLLMAAKVNNMTPKYLVPFLVDAHIYLDQIPYIHELLKRESKSPPVVRIESEATTIFDFKRKDFLLENYNPNPKMKIPVAL